MRTPQTLLMMVSIILLAACGASSGLGGGGNSMKPSSDEKGKSTARPKQSQASDPATEPTPVDAGGQNKSEGGIIESEDIADAPEQVSGAFLFGCAWVEDDVDHRQGIGACTIKEQDQTPLASTEVEITKLEVVVDGSASVVKTSAGSANETFRFPIAYDWYGKTMVLNLEFKLTTGAGAQSQQAQQTANNLKIAGVPTAYKLDYFVLADNPNYRFSCDEIVQQTPSEHRARSLKLKFNVRGPGGTFSLRVNKLCGSREAGAQSVPIAPNWVLTGNGLGLKNTFPKSSSGGEKTVDYVYSDPGQPLSDGAYELTILPGTLSDNSLDDIAAESVEIMIPGLDVGSVQFQFE